VALAIPASILAKKLLRLVLSSLMSNRKL